MLGRRWESTLDYFRVLPLQKLLTTKDEILEVRTLLCCFLLSVLSKVTRHSIKDYKVGALFIWCKCFRL